MTAPRMAPPGAERYDGWRRLAEQAAKELPLGELDQVWTFPKLRHERRELGTAVVSRVQGDRRRIYTGRWALVIRGSERGQFLAKIEEVGSGPLEALEALLLEVRRRVDDAEPPMPVGVREFFGDELLAQAAAESAAAETAAAEAAAEATAELAAAEVIAEASADEAVPALGEAAVLENAAPDIADEEGPDPTDGAPHA